MQVLRELATLGRPSRQRSMPMSGGMGGGMGGGRGQGRAMGRSGATAPQRVGSSLHSTGQELEDLKQQAGILNQKIKEVISRINKSENSEKR